MRRGGTVSLPSRAVNPGTGTETGVKRLAGRRRVTVPRRPERAQAD